MKDERENTNLCDFEGGGTKSVPNRELQDLISLEVVLFSL